MTGNDKELIERAQTGDRNAFAALLEEYYDVMFRMAWKWCGNRSEAEDITQEACIKLARSLGSFRFDAAFTSWLYRLVVNTGLDGRKKHRHEVSDSEAGFVGIVEGRQDEALHAKEVLQQVMELPEREKTALLLVFSEGMSHREASYVMGCKESTVSWYIHEARKKLGVTEKERQHG